MIIFAILYSVVSHYQNERLEESLEPDLIQFEPDELMSQKLKNYLESSNAGFTAEITTDKSTDILKSEGFDTILEVDLKYWGVVECIISIKSILSEEITLKQAFLSRDNLVKARIRTFGRMLSIDNESIVWEREDNYIDDECYKLKDLETQPELVVDILARSIQILAENTVNEILNTQE